MGSGDEHLIGIDVLPYEVLLRIFTFIGPYNVCLMTTLVCKKWKQVAQDKQLWEFFYTNHIGGILHTHMHSSYNLYLSSFKWVTQCTKNVRKSLKFLFASSFGHDRLFDELLRREDLDPAQFQSPDYLVQNQKRNIIQAATELGFNNIVFSALSYAAEASEAIIPFLCCSPDSLGYTAIHIAAMKGRHEILQNILQYKTLPMDIVDQPTTPGPPKDPNYAGGISALHLAAENGHCDILHLLIDHKANINQLDTQTNESALFYAARSGHAKNCEILLQNGADPCISSNNNQLAENVALKAGYHALSDYIASWHNGNERISLETSLPSDNWHLYFGGEFRLLAQRYLSWMVESHKELILPGVDGGTDSAPPAIDLESVYLSLKVDRAGSYERLQAFQRLEQQVVELEAQVNRGFQPEERHAAVVSQLVESPAMPSLLHSNEREDTVSLGQAFQSERGLVVLGDPGGGKTTLARWVALQMARSLLHKQERVLVVASQVHVKNVNTRRAETLVDIGITRLPVLVRVADFAQYLEKQQIEKKKCSLIDFLGYHPWQGSFPSYDGQELWKDELHDLIVDSLKRGRAVVIIDGLDEVANPQQRQDIVECVDKFTWEWIYRQDVSEFDSMEDWRHLQAIDSATEKLGRPVDTGGNQLVVTSRIAGYHSAPMKSPLTHVTIQPMQEKSIKSFCASWMIAVHKIENKGKHDPTSLINFAKLEAQKLCEAICEQPGVRRLAQNPLLLTILALVFRKQKMSLPKRRAQLYRVAMSILVDVWRDCGLSLDETIQTLAPLAAYLHQNRAMGLISKEDLQKRILKSRKEFYKSLPKKKRPTNNEIVEEVKKFIQVVGDQVGFLVARGESMFGFLHQSFQEYLAGWHLVGGDFASHGVGTAATQFIDHIGDARWREPLLLALGMLSERWNEEDREEMLLLILQSDNNVSGALMPRASLLIISALYEMSNLPIIVANKLEVLLLLSYSNQNKFDQNSFELLRYRIEKAFEDLVKMNEEQVIELFIDALTKSKETIQLIQNSSPSLNRIQDFCGACGEIIYKLNIFSESLCSALQHATQYDSSKWGWIIHQNLRRFVSPKYPSEFTRELILSKPWIELPFHEHFNKLEISQRTHKYIITSLCGGFRDFNVVATMSEYYGYVSLLQMVDEARQAIYEQNRSFERWGDQTNASYNIAVHLDTFIPKCFWNVIPVFSLSSLHRWPPLISILSEYLCDIDSFDANKIQEILMFIVKKFGNTQIYKSKLTSAFSSLRSKLTMKEAPVPIDNSIIAKLQDNDLKQLKTDALIGLISMGVDMKKILNDNSFTLHCDLGQLDRVIHSVRDAAARSRIYFYESLKELCLVYDNPHQIQHIIIASLATVTRAANILDITCALGLQFKKPNETPHEILLLKESLTGKNRTLVVGCYILDRLASLNNDDREYYAALCAESLLHYSDFHEFSHAFGLVPILYSKLAQNIPFADPWPVGQTFCAPVWGDTEILPMECLSSIEAVPLNWWKPHALEYLSVTISQNYPFLMPELLTVFLFRVESETGADPFGGLAPPSFVTSDIPVESLLHSIYQINEPYYRVRALWRICRYMTQDETYDEILQTAVNDSRMIHDALRRVVITEHIVEMLPRDQGIAVFAELCIIANSISCRDNRSRALARLAISPLARIDQSSELLKSSLRVANTIPDGYQRATLLQELHMILLQHKGRKELSLWQKAVDKLPNKWCISFAEGNYGRLLFECGNVLSCHSCIEDPWMALTLYALFEDAKSVADLPMNWNSRLWSAILEDQWHERAYKALHEQAVAVGSYGLALDLNAAHAIDGLIVKANLLAQDSLLIDDALLLYERIYRLLSLVGEVSADALIYLPSWLQRCVEHKLTNPKFEESGKKLIQQIALLDAEQANLTIDSIPHVLELIQYGDDRSRIRAQIALHGESFNTGNSFRRLRTSVLGIDVLLLLAKTSWEGMQQKRLMLSQTIRWMGHDLIHDDPDVVERLVELYDNATSEEEQYCAGLWLGTCECISKNAWKTWLKLLPASAASHRVQNILLVAVCKTAHSASHCVGNWPPNAFAELIACGLDPQVTDLLTCCEEWPISVANAAQESLRKHIKDDDYVSLASEAFEEERSRQSLSNHLGTIEALAQFGRSFFHHYNSNNRVESCVPRAVLQLIHTPQILSSVILPWLIDCLKQKENHNGEYDVCAYRKRDSLLQVASGLAKRLPVTFQNCATVELASLLSVATTESVSAFGRIAAMELLSIYGHVSEDTVNAMKCALLDVSFVAESALLCTKQFRYLDDGLLEFLTKELYHQFPSMCLAAARILSAVYLEPCTSPKQRNFILEALAEALRHPSIKNKPVFTMINTAKKITVNHASETMICCVGELDQALFHELSFVCGFSSE